MTTSHRASASWPEKSSSPKTLTRWASKPSKARSTANRDSPAGYAPAAMGSHRFGQTPSTRRRSDSGRNKPAAVQHPPAFGKLQLKPDSIGQTSRSLQGAFAAGYSRTATTNYQSTADMPPLSLICRTSARPVRPHTARTSTYITLCTGDCLLTKYPANMELL